MTKISIMRTKTKASRREAGRYFIQFLRAALNGIGFDEPNPVYVDKKILQTIFKDSREAKKEGLNIDIEVLDRSEGDFEDSIFLKSYDDGGKWIGRLKFVRA